MGGQHLRIELGLIQEADRIAIEEAVLLARDIQRQEQVAQTHANLAKGPLDAMVTAKAAAQARAALDHQGDASQHSGNGLEDLGGVLPRVLRHLRDVLLHDVSARNLTLRLGQGVVAVEGEDAGGVGGPAPSGVHGRRHGVRRLLRRCT